MNKWKDGIISLNNNVIISPGYRFEDFKKTLYYKGQDGLRIIYLDSRVIIDKHEYIISLFFRNNVLYLLSLICCDIEFSIERESERKKIHDEILQKYNIYQDDIFDWGKVVSEYDAKGNVSSINFYYYTTC
jgi:hypothetical protein